MDKDQVKRSISHSALTSTHSSNTTKVHHSEKGSSWASSGSSKISRMIGSIERSILNQFNSNANGSTIKATSNSSGGGETLSRRRFRKSSTSDSQKRQQDHNNNSNNIGSKEAIKKSECTQLLQKNGQNQEKPVEENKYVPQDSNKSISIKLQQKLQTRMAAADANGSVSNSKLDAKGKMTLNKHQLEQSQHCVMMPTSRSNQQQQLPLQNSISSNNATQRLSIPPPHANSEARNQNHRLIFGSEDPTSTLSSVNQVVPFDAASVAAIMAGKNALSRRSKNVSSSKSDIIKIDGDNVVSTPTTISSTTTATSTITTSTASANFMSNSSNAQPNLSPASSAKSLPEFQTAVTPTVRYQQSSRSHEQPIVTVENDEASSQLLYQERRQLLMPNHSFPNTYQDNHSNNMIIMQTTQMPTGSIVTTSYNPQTNHIPPHLLYQYQQQQYIPAQQRLYTSNQVPIMNQPSDQAVSLSTIAATTADQPRISNSQKLIDQQSSQLYHLYHPTVNHSSKLGAQRTNDMILMPNTYSIDIQSSQDIYANAPPKPRRYQFYDQNSFFQQQNQQMTVPNNISKTISTTPFNLSHSQQLNQLYFPPAIQHKMQQQLMPNQQMYRISYLQNPNLINPLQSQQQIHAPQRLGNNSYIHNSITLPYPLTKSKSSLDASDLSRFKLNRGPESQINQQYQQQINFNTQQLQQQRAQSNHHPGHHPYLQQPHIIYGSRYMQPDALASQATPSANQQQPSAQTNLQRSKSVSHLLPNNINSLADERYQMTHLLKDHQLSNNNLYRQPTAAMSTNHKFLSNISASSTSNLTVGSQAFSNVNHQPHLSKVASHLNGSFHQLNTQQNAQEQCNNSLVSATLRKSKLNRDNGQANSENLAFLVGRTSNYQHQQALKMSKNFNNANNDPVDSTNFSSVTSNLPKVMTVGQQQQQLSGGGERYQNREYNNSSNKNVKQSLDDKIRYLMIGEDSGNTTSTILNGAIEIKKLPDESRGYQQQSEATYYDHNINLSHVRNPAKQALPLSTTSTNLLSNTAFTNNSTYLVFKQQQQREEGEVARRVSINVTEDLSSLINVCSSSSSTTPSTVASIAATKGSEICTIASRLQADLMQQQYNMGNGHQQQFQVISNQTDGNHLSNYDLVERNQHQQQSGSNSHLIVDLTTPRVLAKTQTTLLSNSPRSENQRRDSYSFNQVGLPQLSNSAQLTSSSLVKQQNQITVVESRAQQQLNHKTLIDKRPVESSSVQHQQRQSPGQFSERNAPYYYSDLKSEEQRQALLSIVQQKSLSPPPQLLSRSTDQSSTRLAPKSATLHHHQNYHSKTPTNHLPHQQQLQKQRASPSVISEHGVTSSYPRISQKFSSSTSLMKNVDAPSSSTISQHQLQPFDGIGTQVLMEKRIHSTQSMFSLNDPSKLLIQDITNTDKHFPNSHILATNRNYDKASNLDLSSSFEPNVSSNKPTSKSHNNNSESYVTDMRRWSKNFSKSKSLENLLSESTLLVGIETEKRLGVPVYENIKRSDKLMSAINISATCSPTPSSHKQNMMRNTKAMIEASEDVTHNVIGDEVGKNRPAERVGGEKMLNSNLIQVDDEDFIEFLSSSTGNSRLGSQFEASQFSASDFNTSTSASESSALSAGNEVETQVSLTSQPLLPDTTKHLFISASSKLSNTGILKKSRDQVKCSGSSSSSASSIVSSSSDSGDSSTSGGRSSFTIRRSNTTGTKDNITSSNNNNIDIEKGIINISPINNQSDGRFNGVLGNVIDVDMYPVSKLSQSSPVNNHA